jgi:hypothetical protein
MTQQKGRNVAGSHRAKLLTLARNRGEDFQFLLGRWVVERFLYRLGGSAQKDSFVLKGAMLFLAWEGRLHRPTKDLDLLGFGSSDVLDVTDRIREVCAVLADDGIVFALAGVQGERIKEDAEYEGVRVRVPASLDGACVSMCEVADTRYSREFQCGITLHPGDNLLVFRVEELAGPALLSALITGPNNESDTAGGIRCTATV